VQSQNQLIAKILMQGMMVYFVVIDGNQQSATAFAVVPARSATFRGCVGANHQEAESVGI
jgi:hypothetical protein